MIPSANPGLSYHRYKAEIDAAITRCCDKGHFVLGDEVALFEKEFASWVGCGYGIGVANGTDAVHIALASCGIGPGDEVITASHTAVATVAAIECAGAVPVLVDIDEAFFTIDPACITAAITDRTKAIIPVHLYGQSADMEVICAVAQKHGLKVIEDCAQAHGATFAGKPVGTWGDMACYSFYPTKNIGAFGDGGMIVTNDAQLAEAARLIRQYGWKERYISSCAGWNSRLDELQATILRVKLQHYATDCSERARLSECYTMALHDLPIQLPQQRQGSRHVFHQYVIRTERRDALKQYLAEQAIGTLIHYPLPVHQQPAYKDRLRCAGALTVTERITADILSLPLYPGLTDADSAAVSAAIRAFFML